MSTGGSVRQYLYLSICWELGLFGVIQILSESQEECQKEIKSYPPLYIQMSIMSCVICDLWNANCDLWWFRDLMWFSYTAHKHDWPILRLDGISCDFFLTIAISRMKVWFYYRIGIKSLKINSLNSNKQRDKIQSKAKVHHNYNLIIHINDQFL